MVSLTEITSEQEANFSSYFIKLYQLLRFVALDEMIVNSESGRMWEKTVMACFKVLSCVHL